MKTFLKYVGASAIFSFVLFVTFFLFFHEREQRVERVEDQLAGLMACVVQDKCQLPTIEDDYLGLHFLGVYLKLPENNFNVKYMVGNGVVIVVVVQDENNQITLTDTDFDGKVDMVGLIKNGEIYQLSDIDFNYCQDVYSNSLKVAWDRVIPQDIKEALKNMPTQNVSPTKSSAPRIKS